MLRQALPARTDASWVRQGLLVAILLAAATSICLLLEDVLSVASQAMVYMLAVVVAAYATHLRMALAGSLASVALLNYFFVPPKFGFRIDADENITALAAMFAVAVVISQTVAASRREAAQARTNEARARQLQHLAAELADVMSSEEAIAVARRSLDAAYPGGCHVMLVDADGELQGSPGVPLPIREALRECVAQGTVRTAGGDASGEPGLCVPFSSDGRTEGAAYVPGRGIRDGRDREHAQAMCALVGQVLWRLKLAASVQAAQESARWHRAQGTFLAGISHDFRTPLAAMVTAASSLQEQRDRLGVQEQRRLTQVILDEASHLATLTENTLQFARLENEGEIRLDWESMEEIVGSVMARMRERPGSERIHGQVPAVLPLIQADPVLLAQLLVNLLDNALKYGEGDVDLVVHPGADRLEVQVHDRGRGIAPGEEDAVFAPYRRSDRSGQRGAGLGLAVCRAIARAHGGDVLYRPREGGGSSFVLQLPVPAQAPRPAALPDPS